jgi:acyl-CoA reductase-like NAD-dependent aldehyde dehydrogenase
MNKYESFLKQAAKLADLLENQKDNLIAMLGEYEPYDTASDEIERSITALRGVNVEFSNLSSKVDDLSICTFMPLNLPLYSLVLFAIIPGAFSEKVYVRFPEIMRDITKIISETLDITSLFPAIKIKNSSRATFIELYAKTADVILFTGKYKNALIVQEQCPNALFIFNGGGVNPVVVCEDADVDLATNKVFEMRTFNSGQDCAGSDAIFVHSNIADEFIKGIEQKISSVKVGSYGDPSVDVGPILKREYVEQITGYLASESQNVRLLGKVDIEKSIVHPTVLVKNINEHTGGFHEFFAPIFYILVFEHDHEVTQQLITREISDYSMYLSYFSSQDRFSHITSVKLLKNSIVNDVEQGNKEYGGYGSKANFVAFGKDRICRPILISREIDNFYLEEKITN